MNRSLFAAIAFYSVTAVLAYMTKDPKCNYQTGLNRPCVSPHSERPGAFECEKLLKCCYIKLGTESLCFEKGVTLKSSDPQPPPSNSQPSSTYVENPQIDPNTGFPIDPVSGFPIDPQTGMPFDPSAQQQQQFYPPGYEQQNQQPQQPLHTYNPQTGQPYSYNPQTGEYYDPITGFPINQQTGLPYDPNAIGQQLPYQQYPQQPPPPAGQQPVPSYQGPGGQQQQPQPQPSNNINNLLQSLGLPPVNMPQSGDMTPGAMGTLRPTPPPIPQQQQQQLPSAPIPIPQQTGRNVFEDIGYSQCSVVNSIENEDTKRPLLQTFGCKGNEPKIPKEQADQLISQILGPQSPAPPTLNPTATLPTLPPQPPSGPAVGSQLPNYNYIKPQQTLQGQQMCALLKNIQGSIGVSLKLQYNCGATGNTLVDLVAGNLPTGLGAVPSILSLFGGKVTETETVITIKEGAINPDLIPQSILTRCIADRYDYPTCRTGYDTNIYTASECFNIGCLFHRTEYNTRCFRCTLVPSSAFVYQSSADTCGVDSGDRESCPGFRTIQLATILYDKQGAATPAPTLDPLQQLLGSSNPQLSSLLQGFGGGDSSFSNILSNPLFSSLLRSGQAGNPPDQRQLNLQNLLLSQITGGSSGGSSQQNMLLNLALGGGSSSTGNLVNLLYGGGGSRPSIGKISDQAISFMRKECEKKGCCWTAGGNLGGSCFQKGTTFPNTCLPTRESGTCGKSPANDDLSRIVGGSLVTSNKHRPWMAMIKFADEANLRCGGVLICSQWILTTASCLQKKAHATDSLLYVPDLDGTSYDVWVGTLDPGNPGGTGESVFIERIIVHPSFNYRQSYNDIALLKVRSVTFSTSKHPACLPALSDTEPSSGTVYFNGYGATSVIGTQSPLREIPLTVKARSDCRSAYDGALPLSGIFCASPTTDTGVCYGDGGSPAVTYDADRDVFTVVGISYGGPDLCDGSKPALFTTVATFMPWIAQTTNGCCELPGLLQG